MSDFGNLAAYIYELEAQTPPGTLSAMKNRPGFLTPLPEAAPHPAAHPAAAEAHPAPAPAPAPHAAAANNKK